MFSPFVTFDRVLISRQLRRLTSLPTAALPDHYRKRRASSHFLAHEAISGNPLKH
jgi:hypothetical protein